MTSPQSLLYAAASDVTIERVRALVRQVWAESPTVEYKQQTARHDRQGRRRAGQHIWRLATRRRGGRPGREGLWEKTIEAVAEHCAARIEPPWAPEIIPVPLGQRSDLYVLVLRVVRGRHPAPLLVDGVAWVRHQNTAHPADWQRLRDLFAESATPVHDDAWNLHAPSAPQSADRTPDSSVDFVLRSGLSFATAQEAKWRPLSESTVAALTTALNDSPLRVMLQSLSLADAAGRDEPVPPRGSQPVAHDPPCLVAPRTAGRKAGRGQSKHPCASRCPAGTGGRARIYRSRRT